jgi:energy-coupling factor transport system substrate-specific component
VPRLAGAIAILSAAGAAAWTALAPHDAGLSLLLVAGGLIVLGAAWFEAGVDSTKLLVVVATLGGVAAMGRVLFRVVPGVQPVTVICVAAGVALGVRAGVAVGGIAALVSNFFLGQGPWTPWQMLAWGGCGAAGGVAAPLLRRRIPFAVACTLLGFAFSGLMDAWEWFAFFPHTWGALVVQLGRGVWFDAAHAGGNLVLALVAGPELRRLLERYARRLKTVVVWV